MFSLTRKTRIEWGDCDPAGIIFFARYFEFFDVSTTMLVERALGMKKSKPIPPQVVARLTHGSLVTSR
jgi:acyl-CoA thioesterase FadM